MGHIRDVLLKDLWIKIFSLAFAIFLWIFIVGGESAEELFVVPLTIQNIPEDMIISNEVIDFVNVRVRGRRGILRTLNSKKIHVVLDLKDLREGENKITLFPEEVELPEGATAVRVSPSQVTIRLDRLTEKWLPVIPTFMGVPAAGYEKGKVVVTPSKVAVTGLLDALRDQTEIETEHIDLFGKDHSFSVDVELNASNGNVYIKGLQKVRVEVEIRPRTIRREFKGVPVSHRDHPAVHVALNPRRIAVVLSGPESILKNITLSEIRAEIPEQTQAGRFSLKPKISLPAGVSIVKTTPETIRVRVRIPKKTRKVR